MYNIVIEVKNYGFKRKRKASSQFEKGKGNDAKTDCRQSGNSTENRFKVGDGARVSGRIYAFGVGRPSRRQRKHVAVGTSRKECVRGRKYEKTKVLYMPALRQFFSGAGRKPCRLLRQTAQTVGGKAGGRKACGHGFRNRGRFLRRV